MGGWYVNCSEQVLHSSREDRMTPQPVRKLSQAGFTLMELMVVVAIISIVAAAVVPSFTTVLQRHRQREAAQLIIEAAFAARARAARTGRCHRVRVYPDGNDGNHGGSGGAVAVDEADPPPTECGQVDTWTRVMYKSVGPSSDPLLGDAHVGLIGNDVAITAVVAPPSTDPTCQSTLSITDPNIMMFEPTGGLYDRVERFFRVQAFTTDSAPIPMGVAQYVRVGPGGSTRYTLCE